MTGYLRFSLRFVLLVMAVFGCGVGFFYRTYVHPYRMEQHAIAELTKLDASFEYEHQPVNPVTRWLLGESCEQTAFMVFLVGKDVNDDSMRHVGSFRNLKILMLWNVDVTADGLRQIPTNHHIESISLQSFPVPEDSLKELMRIAPNVNSIGFERTGITDRGVTLLPGGTQLTQLDFQNEPVTPSCFRSIAEMYSLEMLGFVQCNAIDDSVVQLVKRLPNLKHLNVPEASVSRAGIQELRSLQKQRPGFYFE